MLLAVNRRVFVSPALRQSIISWSLDWRWLSFLETLQSADFACGLDGLFRFAIAFRLAEPRETLRYRASDSLSHERRDSTVGRADGVPI